MERLIEKRLQSHIDECNHRINKINDFILNNVNANQKECAKNIVVLVNAINAIEEYKKYKILEEQGKLLAGWIPVRERLPEDDSYILVSFENFSVADIARYETDEDGGAFYPGDEDKSYVSLGLFVNAWMPLPGPYRPEK